MPTIETVGVISKPAVPAAAGLAKAAVILCALMIGAAARASGGGAYITERDIRQIGERLSAVATPFALIPEFQSFRMENS